MSSKIYTQQQTTSQDMRTAVGGNVDDLVTAGSAVGGSGGGTIVAGQGATVTQSTAGLSGSDLQGMVQLLQADRESERSAVGSLGESLASGMVAQGQQLGQILGATRAPESSVLTMLMPVLVIAFVVMAVRG